MNRRKDSANFQTAKMSDVPHGRKGKHNHVVSALMSDLKSLEVGFAVKIPLKALNSSKDKVRSALSRAARKASMPLATSSDDEYLYIWKEKQ